MAGTQSVGPIISNNPINLLSLPGPSHITPRQSVLLASLAIPYTEAKINTATIFDAFLARPDKGTPLVPTLDHVEDDIFSAYRLEHAPLANTNSHNFGYTCYRLLQDAQRYVDKLTRQGTSLPRFLLTAAPGSKPERRYIFRRYNESRYGPNYGKIELEDNVSQKIVIIDFKNPDVNGAQLEVGWRAHGKSILQKMKVNPDNTIETLGYYFSVMGFEQAALTFGLTPGTLIDQALDLTTRIYLSSQYDKEDIEAMQIAYHGQSIDLEFKDGRFQLPADVKANEIEDIVIQSRGNCDNMIHIKFYHPHGKDKVTIRLNRNPESRHKIMSLKESLLSLLWQPIRSVFP